MIPFAKGSGFVEQYHPLIGCYWVKEASQGKVQANNPLQRELLDLAPLEVGAF